MKRPFVAEAVRERIVRALEKGMAYGDTADAFSVGIATVNRIWRRYRETGQTSLPPRGGGRRASIPDKKSRDFDNMIRSMPDATYHEYTVEWRKRTKSKVSRSAIVRKVLSLGYTLKKKAKKASEKLTKKNRAKRAAFKFRVKKVCSERLIFIDEAGFQANQARPKSRSLSGEKAIAYAPCTPAYNLTLVGAIGSRGIIAMRGQNRSMTTQRFLSFLRQDLLPRCKPGDVLVMDNLRAHRNKSVRKTARLWNIRVMYLPPYSPELNPIEQVWGWMKQALRFRVRRDFRLFRYQISGAWRKAARLCFKNLLAHCGYLTSPQTI